MKRSFSDVSFTSKISRPASGAATPRRQPSYPIYTEEQIKLIQITFAALKVAKLTPPVQSQLKDRLASPVAHQDSLLQKNLQKIIEIYLEPSMSSEIKFYPLLINCLVNMSSVATLESFHCGTYD